jgi:hypothetical protein
MMMMMMIMMIIIIIIIVIFSKYTWILSAAVCTFNSLDKAPVEDVRNFRLLQIHAMFQTVAVC